MLQDRESYRKWKEIKIEYGEVVKKYNLKEHNLFDSTKLTIEDFIEESYGFFFNNMEPFPRIESTRIVIAKNVLVISEIIMCEHYKQAHNTITKSKEYVKLYQILKDV